MFSRSHALVLSLLLGAAAATGAYAMIGTAKLGDAETKPEVVSSRLIAKRAHKLDSWEASLRKVLDSTVQISILGLLVPGLGSYRPLWVGVGIVAAELMVLVYGSFSQRKRIGAKNWRRLHWATYGIFVAMLVHGIMAGTDTTQPWALGMYLGAIGAVVMAMAWRALVPPPKPKRKPLAAAETG